MSMSDQEVRHSVQTLRHYPKTASGWNQYIRDNVARKRVAQALGLVLPASDENLMAIVIGERGECKGRIFSKLAQTQTRSKIYTHRANPLTGLWIENSIHMGAIGQSFVV